jgi:sterol 3beta-glucosyltransferase
MKIGIQTWGSRGDILPWIALGQGLSKAGHEVILFYSDALGEGDFSSFSIERLTVNSTIKFRKNHEVIKQIPVKQIFDMDLNSQISYMTDEVFAPYEPEIIAAAENLCKTVDLIIIGSILYHTSTIAEKLNIPITIIHVDYQYTPKKGNELFEADINRLLLNKVNNFREKYSLPAISNVREKVFTSSTLNLLIFSKLFKHKQIELPQEFQITGYLFPETNRNYKISENLKSFLENGSPPVYFSIGSLAFFEYNQTEILKVIIQAVEISGCRAIIQDNWNKKTETNNKNIFIINDYIPHLEVFSQCLAVVHHGGAGTTHTTLLAGCPSIVVAYAWDQFYWGKELIRLGVTPGLLRRKYVDSLQLAGDIRKIMIDPEYKNNALKAQKRIKRENGVKNAVNLIEKKIRESFTMKFNLT